jgi:hypothetical protein
MGCFVSYFVESLLKTDVFHVQAVYNPKMDKLLSGYFEFAFSICSTVGKPYKSVTGYRYTAKACFPTLFVIY